MEWKNFISPIFLQDSFPQSLLKFPTSHLLEVLLPTVGKTQWAEQRTRLTKPSSPFKLLLSTCFIRIVSSMHTANRMCKDWASEKKKKKKVNHKMNNIYVKTLISLSTYHRTMSLPTCFSPVEEPIYSTSHGRLGRWRPGRHFTHHMICFHCIPTLSSCWKSWPVKLVVTTLEGLK